jgi:hypothetical protein
VIDAVGAAMYSQKLGARLIAGVVPSLLYVLQVHCGRFELRTTTSPSQFTDFAIRHSERVLLVRSVGRSDRIQRVTPLCPCCVREPLVDPLFEGDMCRITTMTSRRVVS